MYCKMVLKSGATLSELKNDLVGLLTNTVIDKASLTSVDVAASELVILEAAEWTFVQDLADTATRKHFVLEGVEKAGFKKTLGVVLADVSGVLQVQFWVCGPWDSVNKRPMPYDVTGKALATGGGTAADYTTPGGTSRNTIVMLTANSGSAVNSLYPTSVPISDGSGAILVSSYQGCSRVSVHAGVTHQEVLDVYDLPRNVLGSLVEDPAEWPYPLFVATGPYLGNSSPVVGPGIVTGGPDGYRGVHLGDTNPATNVFSSLSAPLSAELGMTRAWTTYGWQGSGFPMLRFMRSTQMCLHQRPSLTNTAAPEVIAAQPSGHLVAGFTYTDVPPIHDTRQVCPQLRSFVSGTSMSPLAYLDEVVIGSDVFVATGYNSAAARCHWKG